MTTLNLTTYSAHLPIALDCNNDRMFHAWQVLASQYWLEADDRQRELSQALGGVDEMHNEYDALAVRLDAMRDWSKAVRNGFVCC